MRTLLFIAIILMSAAACSSKQDQTTEKREVAYSTEELAVYREDGLQMALATKKVLGQNLQAAIKAKGTDHALDFCNIQAIPLTDSVSTAMDAIISRVSDQPRNPDNRANEEEVTIIETIRQTLADGGQPKPQMVTQGDKVIGYYPIITNELCLQCHGSESAEVKATTMAKLKELYPEDEATGYGMGQIRGLFKVEMKGKTDH